ncbi:hypothetical protein AHAS_Ahas03G0178000 [Arachis hypogaea]
MENADLAEVVLTWPLRNPRGRELFVTRHISPWRQKRRRFVTFLFYAQKLQPFFKMSLSLIQGYSSAEEDDHPHFHDSSSDDDAAAHHDVVTVKPSAASHPSLGNRSIFDRPQPSSAYGLPSTFDAFSEVAGPPQFLNNSEEYNPVKDAEPQQGRYGSRRNRKDKKDLPTGAVVEAKPQLVGIHERVRSDNGSQPSTSVLSSTPEEGKRMPTATNPNTEFWARSLLLSMSFRMRARVKLTSTSSPA